MTVNAIKPSLKKSDTDIRNEPVRHVINPVIDFLFLGGASLLIIPAALFFLPAKMAPQFTLSMLILFYFSNYPHFAASYRIFYRDFIKKVSAGAPNVRLRLRYLFAGLVIPIALVFFLFVALRQKDISMLGYSINFIGVLTAWHYLKQGYGMLIVDSVFTRRFFSENEKRVFLYNIYACLLFFWVSFNKVLTVVGFQGTYFHTIAIPSFLFYVVAAVAAMTTLATFYAFARKLIIHGTLPVNGVVAYIATTYLWLLALIKPLIAVTIPIFHAVQYLSVVWRYETNREAAIEKTRFTAAWCYAAFVLTILFIGSVGVWKIPEAHLEKIVAFDRAAYGGTLFLFAFWFFINIHHYFIDNVIWRSENPDTRAYLFQSPTSRPSG